MTPIEFINFNGDSDPNQPVYKVHEAMNKPIVIVGWRREYEILSYYYDNGVMTLEIKERDK